MISGRDKCFISDCIIVRILLLIVASLHFLLFTLHHFLIFLLCVLRASAVIKALNASAPDLGHHAVGGREAGGFLGGLELHGLFKQRAQLVVGSP